MSAIGRAKKPYPPRDVKFDGVAFPTSFANSSPITVTWLRSLRTKGSITFQTDADETPDVTTNYKVKHGPHNPALQTETDLGTGNSGTFNFTWAGLVQVNVYAYDGVNESRVLTFAATSAVGADGVAAGGPIGTASTGPAPGMDIIIGMTGSIPTAHGGPVITPHVSGAFPAAATTGVVDGDIEFVGSGDIGTGSAIPLLGSVAHDGSGSGVVGTGTAATVTGSEHASGAAQGDLGTGTASEVDGTTSQSAAASGAIGTATTGDVDGEITADDSADASGVIGTADGSGVTGGVVGGAAASGTIGGADGGEVDGVATGGGGGADLPTSNTVYTASGASEDFTAQADGVLLFKLWGAAGGGNSSGAFGGSAAAMFGKIKVTAGDTVSISVGVGAVGASATGVANAGGWPNGGYGWDHGGGGGGRSEIRLNGSLIAVAAGGGGAGAANGGLPGGTQMSVSYNSIYGASQNAGGFPSSPGQGSAFDGSSLQGGVSSHSSWGGGGGDGYYGGSAGGLGSGSDYGGTGGSSWFHPEKVYDFAWDAGTLSPTAGFASDADYVSGIGVSTSTAGGDGQIVLALDTSPTYTSLPTDKTDLMYSGSDLTYEVATTGHVRFKLWGGAGGSEQDGVPGAAAAHLDAVLALTSGDIVRIQVAGGGAKGDNTMLLPGGWPNGGPSSTVSEGGTGGGSTNVYVNGVLQLCAAGGGGVGPTAAGYDQGAGYGGDLLAGGDVHDYVTVYVLGATATAGGYPPSKSITWPWAGSRFFGGPSAPSSWSGGGGGGYYGGGSGLGGGSDDMGGSGGSSYAGGSLVVGTPSVFPGLPNRSYMPGGWDFTDHIVGVGEAVAGAAGGNGQCTINSTAEADDTGSHVYWRILFERPDAEAAYGGCEMGMYTIVGSGTNACTGGTITASTTYSGTAAANLLDGSSSTIWGNTGGGTVDEDWVQYEFASPTAIVEVSWTSRNDSDFTQAPGVSVVQFSDNGTDWHNAWFCVKRGWTQNQTVRFAPPSAFRETTRNFWGAFFMQSRGADHGVGEMEHHSTVGGSSQNTGGTPFDSDNFGGNPASLAFDANETTYWTDAYGGKKYGGLFYGFTSGVHNLETRISARDDAYDQGPQTMVHAYSDDGLGWRPAWISSAPKYSIGTPAYEHINPYHVTGGSAVITGDDVEGENVRGYVSASTSIPHRYWRFLMQYNANGNFGGMQLGLCDTVGGPSITTGGTASSNNSYGGLSPAIMFDGVGSTVWGSAGFSAGGVYLEYDFGSGNEKDIVDIFWKARNDGYPDQSPTYSILQWSDDETTWNDAWYCTFQGTWGSGQIQRFTKPEWKPASVHSQWGVFCVHAAQPPGTGGAYSIAELEFRASVGGADQTGSGTPWTPTSYGGGLAPAAFDKDITTEWGTIDYNYLRHPLTYDFGAQVNVREVMLQARDDAYYTQTPDDFIVAFSDDGFAWLKAWEQTTAVWGVASQIQTFANPFTPPYVPNGWGNNWGFNWGGS